MPTSERARALVGWLALHPGPHARAEVAAHLWPQSSEAGARGSLRTALWSLRQCWGPAITRDWVRTGRDVVGFAVEGLWVDLAADLTEAEALTLPDTVLPGLDDDWVAQAGRAHHEHLTRALRSLAERAESEGRVEAAVALTRRWIELEPLDEVAHRALLSRLSTLGDSASAAEVSREFALMLHEELGIRPSPVTRAAQAEAVSGHAPSTSRAALFGRSSELRELQDLWSAAAAGHGQVVVITGEAGIGKTSLLTTFSERVGAKGGRLAVGSGIDVGGETPFGVWLELARALVATAAPVPPNVQWPRELNRLSGQLGAALGRPEPPPAVAAPELERTRLVALSGYGQPGDRARTREAGFAAHLVKPIAAAVLAAVVAAHEE
jgi:DNA-binding SARP family transcriptional activator